MKVDKYDRQIRLWGANGQRLLGGSKVALVGCSGAGIQALKNLVLPGVGEIDIWDDEQITEKDFSQSFFLTHESIGKKKAPEASKNLLEMNPDVKGQFFIKSANQFLNQISSKNKSYDLVIIGKNLTMTQTKTFSETLEKCKIPCIFINVFGHFFHVRLQKDVHFVQSSNINSKKYYLRLNDPFPALKQYAFKVDIYKLVEQVEKIDKYEQKKEQLRTLSNIPYPLILIQVYKALPQNKRTRNQIKNELTSLKEKIHENYRDNFKEAINRIYDLFQTPDNFMIDISLLSHPLTKTTDSSTHLMLHFLKVTENYFQENGYLPQPATLPDMHTTTANYIELKNVYKEEHSRCVRELCNKILDQCPNIEVEENTISQFVNNLGSLEVVEIRPYHEELLNPDTMMLNYLADEKNLLICERAYLEHLQKNGAPPTLHNVPGMLEIAENLRGKFEIENFDKKFVQEVCRSEGRTTININSIAGALTGQEAIKLLTGCFTPMNNGYFFDGANGKGYQVKL